MPDRRHRHLPPAPVHDALLLALWAAVSPLRLTAGRLGHRHGAAAVLVAGAGAAGAVLLGHGAAAAAAVAALWVLAALVAGFELVDGHAGPMAAGIAAGAGAAGAFTGLTAPACSATGWAVLAALVWWRGRFARDDRVRRGQIWWAEIRFHDRPETKIRPVVVTRVVGGGWLAVVPLTSQPGRRERLEVTGPWSRGKRSFARTDDRRIIGPGELRGPIGELDPGLVRRLRH